MKARTGRNEMASGEIILITGEHGARFPDGNCLFVDDELPTVIDPATRKADLEHINETRHVRLVIDTHYHVDHIRYNTLFPDADLAAHPADIKAIESIDGMAEMVGLADKPWLPIWRSVMQDEWGYRGCRVTRPVAEGDEILLGKNTVRFLHVPGHTPGNMCLHFLEKNAVYLADIDLTSFGPWYGNRYSDIDDFLDSIERVRAIGADTWYTAHGDGVIHGDITDRLDAFARVIGERDSRILDFLKEPRAFDEIVDATLIYGKRWEPPEMFNFFEGTMLGKHLARLERARAVARDGDRFVRV
jgi:glyoxylase-like metal-dependent hydrolase (beta-lactamase superfamily II)